jgi:hypothetical protein
MTAIPSAPVGQLRPVLGYRAGMSGCFPLERRRRMTGCRRGGFGLQDQGLSGRATC